MLRKASGVPLHAQLADLLHRQIAQGRLPVHARLPSERDLCEQYDVSRTTVRKALSSLSYQGLIYTTVGKGTYVAQPTLNEELQPLSGFSQDLSRRGIKATSRVLHASVIPADEAAAERLQVPRGAEVVQLGRLRLADDVPIAVQLTQLPHHLCPDLLSYDFAVRSLYDVLRTEYGLRLTRANTVIEAALSRPEETRLLQLPEPSAVLISEQTTFLDQGAAIEFTRSVFRGDRYKLHTHMF